MNNDILFKTDDNVFSYRVAGLLINDGKVLVQRPKNDTGYAIPGGHVSFGETNEQTLIREFKEEIGANIQVDSLKWVGEIFFPWGKKDCHQICLFYLVSLKDLTQIPIENSFWGTEQLENKTFKLEFSWISIKDIMNIEIYPTEVKSLLVKNSYNVEHFVSKEELYTVQLAEMNDIKLWMKLVRFVSDNFPGLETEEELVEYEHTVIKNIKRGTALCAKQNDIIVGVLLFSPHQSCLSCMVVHPAYRRRGIASTIIREMLSLLPPDKDIWVTTFREDDKKGLAPRALYERLGFIPDELIVDQNNYPYQKFILHRK